jgi:hypothetical protein
MPKIFREGLIQCQGMDERSSRASGIFSAIQQGHTGVWQRHGRCIGNGESHVIRHYSLYGDGRNRRHGDAEPGRRPVVSL